MDYAGKDAKFLRNTFSDTVNSLDSNVENVKLLDAKVKGPNGSDEARRMIVKVEGGAYVLCEFCALPADIEATLDEHGSLVEKGNGISADAPYISVGKYAVPPGFPFGGLIPDEG